MMSRLRAAVPLTGIVALAAALRVAGLGFGLPYPHARPDEGTAVGHAVAILAGDPNPHFFHWPSLTLYLFAAAIGLAQAAGVVFTDAARLVFARAIVAAAGALTVLPAAAIAKRLAGRDAGLAAGLFLAVAPLHVRESHFAMTDALMTFLVMASLALALRAQDTGRPGVFAAAGGVAGLAASTKYNAAALLAVAACAPAVAAAAAFVMSWALGFLAATPFALLDWRTFAADVWYDRTHLSGGHGVFLGRGWIYHLRTTLPFGLGPGLALAAAGGLAVLAATRLRSARPLLLFAAAFYLSIGSGKTVFFRYVLPLVPVACVCAAAGASRAAAWAARRTALPERALLAVLAAALAAPSLYQSTEIDRLLRREDSRVIAAAWLTERLHPDATLHDSGSDYTRLWFGATPFHAWRYDAATRSFGDPRGAIPDWIVLYESPLPEYTAAPEPLRELARTRYELAYRVPGVPAGGNGVYDRQDAFFLPIAGFKGVARPGPSVLIYRRR